MARTLAMLNVAATGVTITTLASTNATGIIPNTSAGTAPRMARFVATGVCFVRVRSANAGITAVTTDLMLTAGEPVLLACRPGPGPDVPRYAVIDNGVAVTLNITPLEDS